jgi:hypothetical protein
MYKYYKDLPAWAKGATLIGAGVIVYFLGFKIYKYVLPSDAEKRNKELANNIQSEITKYSNMGMKQSYDNSNYNTMANTIYNSMRYAIGDNYGLVVDTMKKMKNDLDVAKLIKAFGMKQDYIFGLPEGSPKDLFTFVQSELGSEFGALNFRISQINSDWSKKGITYKL